MIALSSIAAFLAVMTADHLLRRRSARESSLQLPVEAAMAV